MATATWHDQIRGRPLRRSHRQFKILSPSFCLIRGLLKICSQYFEYKSYACSRLSIVRRERKGGGVNNSKVQVCPLKPVFHLANFFARSELFRVQTRALYRRHNFRRLFSLRKSEFEQFLLLRREKFA